jgi:hypothetical protein
MRLRIELATRDSVCPKASCVCYTVLSSWARYPESQIDIGLILGRTKGPRQISSVSWPVVPVAFQVREVRIMPAGFLPRSRPTQALSTVRAHPPKCVPIYTYTLQDRSRPPIIFYPANGPLLQARARQVMVALDPLTKLKRHWGSTSDDEL